MTTQQARELARGYYAKAGIILTESESENIEVADFGLNDLANTGLQIVTYINTERCCAKEMVLFPDQMCPEHLHPPVNGNDGKEETFRCRFGTVYLYIDGKNDAIVLNPGEQYTIFPNTKHWFKAGANGAVVSEFSTRSVDKADIFTNPNIIR